MQYAACITIDIDKAQSDPELYAGIEALVFGNNYQQICVIKKVNKPVYQYDDLYVPLYQLCFYRGEDATAFALKYQYAIQSK